MTLAGSRLTRSAQQAASIARDPGDECQCPACRDEDRVDIGNGVSIPRYVFDALVAKGVRSE